MSLTIHLPANLQPATDGQATISLDTNPATVADLIASLVARFPDLRPLLLTSDGMLLSHVNVFVDGRSHRDIDGLQTSLADAREIVFLTALAGG
ncbi:MAG: MoaD/ThiS family protein [Planctomycetota bacterium]|nr:MAG: MoaD/ThiS family protein [Planctomycetota bacterium]